MSTVYPNAEPVLVGDEVVGEAYLDTEGDFGYIVYDMDFGAEGMDSLDDAIEECRERAISYRKWELEQLADKLWDMKKRGLFDDALEIIKEVTNGTLDKGTD